MDRPKPLTGLRVLAPPARVEMNPLGQMLKRHGADVVIFPTLQVAPPRDWAVVDAGGRPSAGDGRLSLGTMRVHVEPKAEWNQMLRDAWRLERDYFYDPDMHGVDWEGVRDKYLPLVDRVTTRDELSDLIGRVVGELSALHTSVRGGDLREGDDDVPDQVARTRRAGRRDGGRNAVDRRVHRGKTCSGFSVLRVRADGGAGGQLLPH